MRSLLLILALAVLAPQHGEAQPTIEQYQAFPLSGRTGYVVGWYGGFMYGFLNFITPQQDDPAIWHSLFGAGASGVDVKLCMEQWTFSEMRGLFDIYVERNPALLAEQARVHLGLAIIEACSPLTGPASLVN